MPFAWRPLAGQVTLIEIAGENECLTGVVVESDDESAPLVIDLGASPHPPTGEVEVVASFFAPDALYRMTALATPRAGGTKRSVIDLTVRDVERVQRRRAHRAKQRLQAVLSNLDDPGDLVSVVGETVDIGEGGCRLVTAKPFPAGVDPTITIHLPDGHDLVVLGAILQAEAADGAYHYRVVFLDIDDDDRERLSAMIGNLSAA